MPTENNSMTTCASSISNMNHFQNQSYNFDLSIKSDHDDKCHLENKYLFRNSQFLEGKCCDTNKRYKHDVICNCCQYSPNKTRTKKCGSTSNKKSGDWNCDEEWINHSLMENSACDTINSDWKCKNLYSISDFDRSHYWNPTYIASGNPPRTVLHDVSNKVENHMEDTESDTEKNYFYNLREYLVNYQESCGVPRSEYSFAALVRIMSRATARSLLALLYVIVNVAPVVEVFLYILRFVLDKIIGIRKRKDFRQIIVQYLILALQLLSIYACLMFIFGFIVLPIVQMVIGILAKIMLYS